MADDNGSGNPGTHVAEYTYLGLNQNVKADYTEPDLRYNLDHGATGSSAGAGGGAATVPYPASAGAGSQTLLPAASVGGAAVTVGVGATLDPEDTRAYPR